MGDTVLVYGAGGHGRVVVDILQAMGWEVRGLVDDNPPAAAYAGLPIRTPALWRDMAVDAVALGIGDNAARQRVATRLLSAQQRLLTAVHPSAVVSPQATLAAGVVVMPHAVINAQAQVHMGAVINSGAVVEHDCVLGAFCHVSCHATLGGGAVVGELSLIGLGATVLLGRRVGSHCTVGAGAVVTRHVPDASTVRGIPARA